MKMCKRFIYVTLILSMALALLSGCAEAPDDDQANSSATESQSGVSDTDRTGGPSIISNETSTRSGEASMASSEAGGTSEKSIAASTTGGAISVTGGEAGGTNTSSQETYARRVNSFSYSDGIDENGFWEGVHALDYVELFDYKAVSIPYDVHYVPEETIQGDIDSILSTLLAEERIFDRAIVDGDTVNIDFIGSIDGVEFEGGSTDGMGINVIIGETDYIDNFLEQLIGYIPGDTVDVEVTFPDDYSEESLQGKKALFVTVINYIVRNAKKELSDEFVVANLSGFYGWTTVDEMKESLRASSRKPAVQRYINQYLSYEVTVKSIPDSIINYLEQATINGYREDAEKNGIEFEEYLAENFSMSSAEELIEASYEYFSTLAKLYLVVQAVAEDSGITINREDLADYFLMNSGTSDYSSYEARYGLPWLKQNVLCQNVVDYIAENAVFE